ncbi:MAG: nuclear transport factor 2 family protein [Sphingomonadales bacterium]|nr:nuclear transport factor 2 family protein [Sphingomonadales bacterium]
MIRQMGFAALLLFATLGIAPASSARGDTMRSREAPAAMDFLAALGRLDFDAVDALLDDQAVLELPFAGEGLTVRGREEILRFFRKSMAGSVQGIEYRLERAYPSPQAGAVVLEVSTQVHAASGRDYTNRLIVVFQFRHGKIALFREYFNPVALGR